MAQPAHTLRKSDFALAILAAALLLVAATPFDAARRQDAAVEAVTERADLVKSLQLTDLVLFTEARYTRHPSQADLHTAFQDHPMAFEHFPSGALLMPPPGLRGVSP